MSHLPKLLGLVALLPLATGCLARTAPFDQLDRSQVTVLRLTSSQAPAQPQSQPGALLPQIPGVPPELAQMGQQILQGAQGMIPPSILPPGSLPGTVAPQQQQQLPQFKGFSIVSQMPLMDEHLRDELLEVFGHEASFNNQVQPCFSPGMAVVFQRPNAPEVDLMISLSCNQVKMDGARWPYAVNGLTPETRDHLGKLYEKLWGPVPPGA